MNDEIVKIKKQNPLICLLDKTFEDELGVTTYDLYTQGRNYFMTKCRVAYTNIISIIVPNLGVIETGKLINRNHATVSWQRKKYYELIKEDESFQSMYKRVYNKFNQLKREQENGMG